MRLTPPTSYHLLLILLYVYVRRSVFFPPLSKVCHCAAASYLTARRQTTTRRNNSRKIFTKQQNTAAERNRKKFCVSKCVLFFWVPFFKVFEKEKTREIFHSRFLFTVCVTRSQDGIRPIRAFCFCYIQREGAGEAGARAPPA